jgi:hypothetical protein
MSIGRYYLIDDTPRETLEEAGLGDFRLIIGPDPDDGDFVIYRCNEPTYIPEGSFVYIIREGDMIHIPPKEPFQTYVAQLLLPEDVENPEQEGDVEPMPQKFTGVNLPEKDVLREDYFEQMCLSLTRE